MWGTDKSLPFALKILISKIYDANVFWKLPGNFQENTLGGVIFCLRESEILLKKEIYHLCFLSWEIIENE